MAINMATTINIFFRTSSKVFLNWMELRLFSLKMVALSFLCVLWWCWCPSDINLGVYFRMLYSSEVREMRMLVAENQRVVIEPTLEFCDFTLLGSTYTISFCCK